MPLGQLESARVPLPFGDFRFSTIGQQPQLLKRISSLAQKPSYDRSHSPGPNGASSEGDRQLVSSKSRSKLPLVEDLENENFAVDTIMSDGTNEIMAIHPQTHTPVSLYHGPGVGDRSPQLPPANQLGHARSRIAHATLQSQIPKSSTPGSSPGSQNAPISTPAAENIQASVNHIFYGSNETFSLDSSLISLRDLHARLLLSIADLHPPNITNALVLAQNANSHATNALSEAQRAYTLAQQSLSSAKDAAAASRECLRAAEQAKADASDAVAAVDHLGSGTRISGSGLNEGGQWRSVIIRLQDDLRALGEWVRERESEEISRKQEVDKRERNSIYRLTAEDAVSSMTETKGSFFRETQLAETSMNARDRGNANPVQSALLGQKTRLPADIEVNAATGAQGSEKNHYMEPVSTGLSGATSAEAHPVNENIRNPSDDGEGRQDLVWSKVQVSSFEEEKRKSELYDRNLEIARFRISERNRIAEDLGRLATLGGTVPIMTDALGIPKDEATQDSATITKHHKRNEARHTGRPSSEVKKDIANLIPEASTMVDTKSDELRVAQLIQHRQAGAHESNSILPQSQDIAQNVAVDTKEHSVHASQIHRTISLEAEDDFPYPNYPAHLTYPPSRMSSAIAEVPPHTSGDNLDDVQVIPEFQTPPTSPKAETTNSRHMKRLAVNVPGALSEPMNQKNPDIGSPIHRKVPISPKLSQRQNSWTLPTEARVQEERNLQPPCPPVHHVEEQRFTSPPSCSPLSKSALNNITSPLSPSRSARSPEIALDAPNPVLKQILSNTEHSPVPLNSPRPPYSTPEKISDSGGLEHLQFSRPSGQDKQEHGVSSASPQGGEHAIHSSSSIGPTREILATNPSPVERQAPPPLSESITKVTQATIPTTSHPAYSPPPTAPILGKRRYNESSNLDEHTSRRQWLPDDRRETSTYTPRGKPPSSTSSTWRPPGRPNLQSRVARDYETVMIGNGQSYRPTYAHSYQPAGEDSMRSPPSEHYDSRYAPDSRDEIESHYSRGRGSGRGGFRGRGGYTGGRQLNLEQRISSNKPPALLNRLGSPLRRR